MLSLSTDQTIFHFLRVISAETAQIQTCVQNDLTGACECQLAKELEIEFKLARYTPKHEK